MGGGWNYRVLKCVDEHGKEYLALHEVYYKERGKHDAANVDGWTATPVEFVCDADEGIGEIQRALEQALSDVSTHGVLVECELPGFKK